MLLLKKELYEEMLAHCMAAIPNEACGLVAGTIEGGNKRISKVYLLHNVDESPVHFSIDPKEQLAAYKDARANGKSILGNFHSHPSAQPEPSAEDKRLAYDPMLEYLIFSLQDRKQPILKAFGIDGEKNVTEHGVTIE